MFKREQERAYISSASLVLKPLYRNKVEAKQFPPEYKVPKFQKFDIHKGNMKKHVARSVDSMSLFSNDTELCVLEFSMSLIAQAYT